VQERYRKRNCSQHAAIFVHWKNSRLAALFSDIRFVSGGNAPRAKSVVFAAWPWRVATPARC
jgi:hypothetical protein